MSPLSGLLTLWWVPFVIGCWQIRTPHCCCRACNLPGAPRPASSCCCQVQSVHGPLYGLPLLLSPSHTLPVPLSGLDTSHCRWVPFFKGADGHPIACLPAPRTLWLHTLVLAP
ncbi:unnamed protein product [Staurois parvus]|uniref:Secreted protein n=1 Tax=Staurois parvus TaxID=386267 RepID=A0ABN9BWT9_9NEOB|nr:unnamed protein product [Staurois parvus]